MMRVFVLVMFVLGATARASSPVLALRWEEVSGVVGYVVEIAEDPDFRRVVIKQRVPSAELTVSVGSPDLWWRVASVDALGRRGDFGATRRVPAVASPPGLLAPVDGATYRVGEAWPEVGLTWQEAPFAVGYQGQISRDRRFRVATDFSTPDTVHALVPAALGTHCWRVRTVNASGAATDWTEPRCLRVGMEAPTGLREHIVAVAGTPAMLRWAGSAATEHYEVEIVGAGAQATIRSTPDVKLDVTLPRRGDYRWRVRSRSGETVSAWSAPASLAVADPPPPRPGPAVARASRSEERRVGKECRL